MKGCPRCGGTRFFYTKKPLDDTKRGEIEKETEKNTVSLIDHLLKGNIAPGDTSDKSPWITLKPRKVQEIIAEVAHQKQEAARTLAEEEEKDEKLESISVNAVGEYEINLRRLLQEESVIIQKDGSYLIHLPSVFQETRKKTK